MIRHAMTDYDTQQDIAILKADVERIYENYASIPIPVVKYYLPKQAENKNT